MSIHVGRLNSIFEHSLLKFATVGVINTLLSIAVIFSLKSMTDLSDVMANFIGYMVGLACSFVLNKQWTFKSIESLTPTLLKFLIVFGFSYALNITVVLASINFGVNDYFAHLIGIPFYSIAFYFGCKYFAFTSKHKIEQQ